ncbi:Chromo domain-like protein [Metarhizium album ARSEF 1941]|uniref:Chromo domain-like protein n=1 Tax=Metarhizium album (strain ARSEF 1941) TaxID=1081103 RepID=A0A0B2WS94_METAS|nr:Chromo domain-like protein [Metarhizium album ARSEF 1941]KHN98946.1 Chromo domain-like protein [Metarhizium album ARSEF 1941]
MASALVLSSSDEESQSSESATASPEPTSKPTLVIEIRPRPKYTPGCGPSLQPLRLLPPASSSAYIIERILLPSPGLAVDGKPLPKRMTYIVGWHDLPAASLLVPAMDILDYVSPRALEDWEETLEDELDQERIKLAEERKIGLGGLKQKHKARPPAHTDIEPAAAIESETERGNVVRPKMGAMSLSTPQKRKLADFEGLSDNENSPTNQLAREIFGDDSCEDSWDAPLARAGNGDMQIEFMNDTVDSDAAQRPKREIINTPVPLPSYINRMPGYETTFIEPNPATTPIFKAGDASRAPDHADLVACVEGTASSSAAGLDGLTGSLSLPKSSYTRESNGDHAACAPAAGLADSSTQQSTRPKSAKKRRKESPIATNQSEKDGEPTWEVERLEDMAFYNVEGQGLVRYFLVRWSGDWPPNQQTSWEPDHHLPRKLIRTFTKLDKKSRARLRREREPPESVAWGDGIATYSSVNDMAQAEDRGNDLLLVDTPQGVGEKDGLFIEDDL